jgi:hypothetical protein
MQVHDPKIRRDSNDAGASFPDPATIAAVATPVAASYFGWMVLTGLIVLVAVIRVIHRPAEAWPHRNWSKVAWVLAVLYVTVPLGGFPIPIGAVAAVWHTRRRPQPSFPYQLPTAEGSPGIWEDK